jgi:hypothetical protein
MIRRMIAYRLPETFLADFIAFVALLVICASVLFIVAGLS